MLRAFCACLALALALTVAATGDSGAQQRSRRQQQQQQQPQPEPQPPAPAAPQAAPQPEPSRPAAAPPPAPERRAAEPAPIPVKVVEPPKTETELAAERQEQEERATFNTRLLIYGGLLVAVGFLLFVAFLVQTLYLWLALRSLRRSATLTERNMTTAQRAFIYLGSLTWSAAGANINVSPVWANSGTTPTRSLRISTNWRASHGELPADYVFSYVRPPERLFLGPNGRAEVGAMLIPMRDIQAAIEERVHIYVWGRATYEDIFEGTEPHFVEFCYRLEATGATPSNVALTFTHHGVHNRSDEDSQRALGHDIRPAN